MGKVNERTAKSEEPSHYNHLDRYPIGIGLRPVVPSTRQGFDRTAAVRDARMAPRWEAGSPGIFWHAGSAPRRWLRIRGRQRCAPVLYNFLSFLERDLNDPPAISPPLHRELMAQPPGVGSQG